MEKRLKFFKASISDLEEIQKLFVQTIKAAGPAHYNPAQINTWISSVKNTSRWTEAIKDQYFLLSKIEDTLVGFASLKGGCYIDFMYVHYKHFRKGIAKQLLAQLEKEALELGHYELTADVSKTALAFFELNGFKMEKENQNIRNGVLITNYRMKKILQD
ncbi:putative acetyltransferase [Christiangramia gaetbulicola]|uniref:Putative acetyltransferase n=1 Tax=Christiangramia gaetbulicola TaxID=703340 RepID=A0A2T6ALY6_9FLAO|nr:GNAT family N-acetyltransferase [Christiangramia gaetbulicola]PTX44820.1 putative acetyltransferase [Christiangramia gaetbulicola]